MNSTLKNVSVILLIFTLAFAGYYFFIKNKDVSLGLDTGSVGPVLFADVQKYIARSEIIDKVKLDTTLFADERFKNLVDYSPETPVSPIAGRENPFDEI